jgi:hypothetical protein
VVWFLNVILCEGQDSREADEVEKELEHTLLLNTMDNEMHELNKRLEQKEVIFMICFEILYISDQNVF